MQRMMKGFAKVPGVGRKMKGNKKKKGGRVTPSQKYETN
jgi:hypothetical protein